MVELETYVSGKLMLENINVSSKSDYQTRSAQKTRR